MSDLFDNIVSNVEGETNVPSLKVIDPTMPDAGADTTEYERFFCADVN